MIEPFFGLISELGIQHSWLHQSTQGKIASTQKRCSSVEKHTNPVYWLVQSQCTTACSAAEIVGQHLICVCWAVKQSLITLMHRKLRVAPTMVSECRVDCSRCRSQLQTCFCAHFHLYMVGCGNIGAGRGNAALSGRAAGAGAEAGAGAIAA